jgi:hypothetical protein
MGALNGAYSNRSLEEAARYLETFRAYEKRQADIIKQKVPPRTGGKCRMLCVCCIAFRELRCCVLRLSCVLHRML